MNSKVNLKIKDTIHISIAEIFASRWNVWICTSLIQQNTDTIRQMPPVDSVHTQNARNK